MNKRSRFLAILKSDRKLSAMFGGIVLGGLFPISLIITAGIWYL